MFVLFYRLSKSCAIQFPRHCVGRSFPQHSANISAPQSQTLIFPTLQISPSNSPSLFLLFCRHYNPVPLVAPPFIQCIPASRGSARCELPLPPAPAACFPLKRMSGSKSWSASSARRTGKISRAKCQTGQHGSVVNGTKIICHPTSAMLSGQRRKMRCSARSTRKSGQSGRPSRAFSTDEAMSMSKTTGQRSARG